MIPQRLQIDGIRFVLLEKGGKRPFQPQWQTKNIQFSDYELNQHIQSKGNYGVMGGGERKVVIVDFDNDDLQSKLVPLLPKTFTVKTGSGKLHKYFFSDGCDSFKIFDEEMNTLADIQGEGKQVVAPGSIHPNGNVYEVLEDNDIAFIPYSELKALIMPFDRKPKKEKQDTNKPTYQSDETNFSDIVKSKIRLEEVLGMFGVDTSKNPTNCPFHSSKGGKCLGFNSETWHCFHCEESGNIFSLVMKATNSNFKDTLLWFANKFNLQQDYDECKKKFIQKAHDERKASWTPLKTQLLQLLVEHKEDEASELIATQIKKDNKIYTTRDDLKSEIWFYDAGIYIPNGETKIKEISRELLECAYTPQRVNKIIAKIEADTYIDQDKFFTTNYKWEVPVQNGILNIQNRQLTEFTPDKIFFNKCPVIYDPSKTCQNIDKFLSEVLANAEDRLVFYEIGGFCLLKEYTFEKAFMLVGSGRNGKGKSLELLKRVIGPENCFSLSLAALNHENADVSQLFGKMVNLAGDIGNKDLEDTSLFKGLTGRDLVTTKRKFLKALTFENYAKFIFGCNELPKVYDLSKGFWDRWVLLEYPYYFADKEEFEKATDEDKKTWKLRDEDIINKIATPEELSGLLNAFLDGLDRLLKNRKFSSTKGSEDVKNTWIRKSDSFQAFCMDMIEESYSDYITKKALRSAFSKYCKLHKLKGASDKAMKITLENMFGVTDGRKDVLGSFNEYVWEGIRWKS